MLPQGKILSMPCEQSIQILLLIIQQFQSIKDRHVTNTLNIHTELIKPGHGKSRLSIYFLVISYL